MRGRRQSRRTPPMRGSSRALVRRDAARRRDLRDRNTAGRPGAGSTSASRRSSETTRYRLDRDQGEAFGSSTGTPPPRDTRRLAFAEGSRFGRSRAWRFLRFDGKVGGEPFGNPAFEDADLHALPQQLAGDASTDQLVGVRVVGDDIAAGRNGHGIDSVRRYSYRAGQLDGAVFVGVFEPNV